MTVFINFVKIESTNLQSMKTELNTKPLPQFEEETKEGLAFFSRDIVIINQDMVFSHLPEWKREQILNILMDYVD